MSVPDHEFVLRPDLFAVVDSCARCGRPKAEHITVGDLIGAIKEHRAVRYGDRTPDYTVDIKLYAFAGVG